MPIFWSSWELWMRSSIATLQEWLCPTWSRCRTARLAEDCVEHFATSRGWNSHLTSNHNFPWFNGVLVQVPWVMTWTWAVWVPVFHFLWGVCRMFDGQLFFHWESTHAWGYLSSASRPAVEKSYGQAWLPMWNSFAVVVRVAWLRWVNQAGIVGVQILDQSNWLKRFLQQTQVRVEVPAQTRQSYDGWGIQKLPQLSDLQHQGLNSEECKRI